MRLLLSCFCLLIGVDYAWACRCAAGQNERLWHNPEQARIAALVKLKKKSETLPPKIPSSDSEVSDLVSMPWTKESLASWVNKGSTCDLRPLEDVWYILVTNSQGAYPPTACDSLIQPAAEGGELIVALSRSWKEAHSQQNPAWSVGCKESRDCVVIQKGRCREAMAVTRHHSAAAARWQKNKDSDSKCIVSQKFKVNPSAICHTGVCEFKSTSVL